MCDELYVRANQPEHYSAPSLAAFLRVAAPMRAVQAHSSASSCLWVYARLLNWRWWWVERPVMPVLVTADQNAGEDV